VSPRRPREGKTAEEEHQEGAYAQRFKKASGSRC
jgi:hypothetical protein